MGQGDPGRQHQGGVIRIFHNLPIPEVERSVQQRIGAVIRAYEEQGFHRTGTEVDRLSGGGLLVEGAVLAEESGQREVLVRLGAGPVGNRPLKLGVLYYSMRVVAHRELLE